MIGREVYFLCEEYTDEYRWRHAYVISEDHEKAAVAYRQGADGIQIRFIEHDKLFDEAPEHEPRHSARMMPDMVVRLGEGNIKF